MSVFDSPLSGIDPPMNGQLALYRTGQHRYPYFTSGDVTSSKAIILIGGLTAGMCMVPYSTRLSETLKSIGWKLVQHHWSSAYMGYGLHSLDRDAQEMEDLVKQLVATGTTDVIFMGNSTGCQDIAKFLSTRSHPAVRGGIMQAPVSDREFFTTGDGAEAEAMRKLVPEAKKAIDEGRGWELVPKDVWEGFGGRITWDRFFSLLGVGGDDDYFSSNIPIYNPSPDSSEPQHAHPLSESFGRFSAPALALWSENDEFAWKGAPPVQERFDRWTAAMPEGVSLRCAVIPGADHEVHQEEAQGVLMEEVKRFIADLGL